MAGNPRRNALFSVVSETRGLQGLGGGGGRAQTGDPPPSHRTSLHAKPGTEFSDAETGAQRPPLSPAETDQETRRSAKSPHSGAAYAAYDFVVYAIDAENEAKWDQIGPTFVKTAFGDATGLSPHVFVTASNRRPADLLAASCEYCGQYYGSGCGSSASAPERAAIGVVTKTILR